ncbi:MAG TPA: tRNA (adenosine(37)-N6)-threonylcarbamoyltransferase complex dimerization subunit type 1 TsaB [Acidobacteria bacterium]|nr:tRNA (adenosine(37)-N6)-threonylcarbamoyltransferase complex dimerization subunit type 1 TsaB [Acidobacteriota bacterium]
MLILALDTTTADGSVAIARDGRLLDEHIGDPAVRQGQRLPGDIESLLARHGLTTGSVDRYAVALGPGSFTGLRVGIATIQALALVHGRPVVGLSVLDALVDVVAQRFAATDRGADLLGLADLGDIPDVIVPWVDAKRGEVFAAIYEPAQGERTTEVRPGTTWRVVDGPVAVEPEPLLDRWGAALASRRTLFIGDGVSGTRTLLESRLGPGSRTVDRLPPLAGVMARMAGVSPWCEQASTPHALRPVYVRRHYADLARAKQQTATAGGAPPDAHPTPGPPAAE